MFLVHDRPAAGVYNTDLTKKHLPEFNSSEDPRIGGEGKTLDACQHSIKLGKSNTTVNVPQGTIMSSGKDYIHLVNACLASNEHGQRFRSRWIHSNIVYGLLANLVECSYWIELRRGLEEQSPRIIGTNTDTCLRRGLRKERRRRSRTCENVKMCNGEWSKIENTFMNEAHAALLCAWALRAQSTTCWHFVRR